MYPKHYAPRYTIAFSVNVAMCGIAISGALLMRYMLRKENRKLEQSETDQTLYVL
jgi:hypothetical protein